MLFGRWSAVSSVLKKRAPLVDYMTGRLIKICFHCFEGRWCHKPMTLACLLTSSVLPSCVAKLDGPCNVPEHS